MLTFIERCRLNKHHGSLQGNQQRLLILGDARYHLILQTTICKHIFDLKMPQAVPSESRNSVRTSKLHITTDSASYLQSIPETNSRCKRREMLELRLCLFKHRVAHQHTQRQVQVHLHLDEKFGRGVFVGGAVVTGCLHSVGQLQFYAARLQSDCVHCGSCRRDLNSLNRKEFCFEHTLRCATENTEVLGTLASVKRTPNEICFQLQPSVTSLPAQRTHEFVPLQNYDATSF